MKIHDLTNLIKYKHSPLPTRLYTGHYGDGYMLPKYCILSKTKGTGAEYGLFVFTHPEGLKGSKTISVYYSDDEAKAYERFINKISRSTAFCNLEIKTKTKTERGQATISTYKHFDIPKIKGVSLLMYRNVAYMASSAYRMDTICTNINIHSSREDVIQKIKEHIAKMPAEWLAKHHIPEFYLA